MHHANHFYGHAHIMARYTGLAEVPRVWGYLQHGWNVHDGFAVGTQFVPGFAKFVWSEAPARRGWAAGLRNYVVVGSPWAYLLHMKRQDAWEAQQHPREGTIVYPFHGWEQQSIVGSHDGYVREIQEKESGPVTICLYWNEYRDKHVRAIYERAGFRVISHGYRGHMWVGTDTAFLDKQLAELRRHHRVVSNRMGSALFYGASVGCEVGIYGDPMVLEAERAILGGMERQRRLWPEMHQPAVAMDVAREYARVELGLDNLLHRTEILRLFGWEHARRGVLVGSGASGDDSLAVVSTGERPTRQDALPTDDQHDITDDDHEPQ